MLKSKILVALRDRFVSRWLRVKGLETSMDHNSAKLEYIVLKLYTQGTAWPLWVPGKKDSNWMSVLLGQGAWIAS